VLTDEAANSAEKKNNHTIPLLCKKFSQKPKQLYGQQKCADNRAEEMGQETFRWTLQFSE